MRQHRSVGPFGAFKKSLRRWGWVRPKLEFTGVAFTTDAMRFAPGVDGSEEYHRGILPLAVPLTLIRHWVRRFDIAYLKSQTYPEPHPRELMLRNHM